MQEKHFKPTSREVAALYRFLRPLLFRLSPETAHRLVMHTLSFAPWVASISGTKPRAVPTNLNQSLWNLSFPHPVGLAAGLDKDGIAINGLLDCGFSFIELGTVTPKAQPGNPTPRMFRLVEDEALINRMGFNNQGALQLHRNVMRRRRPGVIGINIGKNKITPNSQASSDYVRLVNQFYLLADYITINVSSPNTPGLRDLQDEEALIPLVQAVIAARDYQFMRNEDRVNPHRVPILVKLAPDLADESYEPLAYKLAEVGVDGFIATNTTISRVGLKSENQREQGGLSGRPLGHRSTEVISKLYRATEGRIPIIGSGGVFGVDDAYEKIRAGASLVQVYTGFIYKGPSIIQEIIEGVSRRLVQDGFSNIREAVGTSPK